MKNIYLVFVLGLIFSNCSKVEQTDSDVVFVIDKKAEYIGGSSELMKFLNSNTIYPAYARENNIQGKVIAQFTIDAKGKVANPIIVQSANKNLDDEVIRVINLMPDWSPAIQKGVAVESNFTLPVTFKLSGLKKTDSQVEIIFAE